jgi:hypothetical protein
VSKTEGTLELQSSGGWALVRPGHLPIDITSGEVFELQGKVTRMEYRHFESGGGEYYSVDDLPLGDGMRVALIAK